MRDLVLVVLSQSGPQFIDHGSLLGLTVETSTVFFPLTACELSFTCNSTSAGNKVLDSGNKEFNFPPFPSQWECKTDLDNAYRFGRIEVSCEGYSHPADALILKGSCGLEYTLELTEEGRRKTQGSWGSRSGFNGFGGRKMDM